MADVMERDSPQIDFTGVELMQPNVGAMGQEQ